jgi:hypothetical protein
MMRTIRPLISVLLFLLLLGLAADVHAVIYRYTDEKGKPAFADSMEKIPESQRAVAVIVTGQSEQELADDAERTRALAARQAEEQAAAAAVKQQARERFVGRLIRAGVALALTVGVLLALTHIDALREQADLLRRIRIGLVAVLLAFLGVNFAADAARLFRSVGKGIADPVADLRDHQGEKGRKAAESYKALGRTLEKAQREAGQVHEQFDGAEEGK